jgi:hypothetical protein
MPAESEAQRRWAGAELARKRAGKRTDSGMSEKQLKDFAHKPTRSSSRSKRRSRRS